jgi:hypothetical protein
MGELRPDFPPKRAEMSRKAAKEMWAEALTIAALAINPKTKMRRLTEIAIKVVEMASQGDMRAVQEIALRLDGPPVQEVNVRRVTSIKDLSDGEIAAILSEYGNRGEESGAKESDSVH